MRGSLNLLTNMNEITIKNFDELFPVIKETLEDATFIAIDSEFTGLESDEFSKSSLFDTIEERYEKMRKAVEPFIVLQFGITAFKRIPNDNRYTAKIFNFYLLPSSIAAKNKQFVWQVSTIEFLSSYNFDFNQALYYGIPYIDETEEAKLKQQLKENKLYENIENNILYKDADEIRDYSTLISGWLRSDSDVEFHNLNISKATTQYLLQKELRSRFPVWTTCSRNMVTVFKVPKDVHEMLEIAEKDDLEHALLDYISGFSKIFKLLVQLKKPIIGHNMLLDLIYMYKLFYRPLPNNYSQFKSDIHNLFPVIYDTKYLSNRLKDLFDEDMWNLNSLGNLYTCFSKGKGSCVTLNSPLIEINNNMHIGQRNVHNAGWDSYLTGYIFVKMAYIFVSKKYGEGVGNKILTNAELMSATKDHLNCIYLSRASSLYLKLDGPDPKSERPQWLFVKPLSSTNCNLDHISKKLLPFGMLDVKPIKRGHVLVAVSNHKSASEILKHFHHNKELYVTRYHPIRHSPMAKFVLIGSMLVSGGVLGWIVHRSLQKSRF